jgi:hypothetical protein
MRKAFSWLTPEQAEAVFEPDLADDHAPDPVPAILFTCQTASFSDAKEP